EYWSPHEVAGDMHYNMEQDAAGRHPEPHFSPDMHADDQHEERWTRSIVPAPKPEDDPGYADAKAHALRDMEHHYAARHIAGYTDEELEHHLRAHHGYDDRSIHRNLEAGNRLGDLHAAIHDAGLASHPDHTEPSVPRSEEIASQFGKPVIPSYHNRAVRPESGG